MPWAMKSTLAFERVPSSLGADSATPTPCTSTIAATASAPASSDHENADSCGPGRQGDAPGDVALVLDLGDVGTEQDHAMVGTAKATTAPNEAIRVRAEHDDDGHRGDADEHRHDRDLARMGHDVPRLLRRATDPSAGAPVRSGIWPAMMLTETPLRKPIITEWLTNRVNRPRRSSPAGSSPPRR